MQYLLLLPFFASLLLAPVQISAAQDSNPTEGVPQVAIYSPTTGQALQGTISVTGKTLVEGFLSAELSFAYTQDLTDTWFLIYESDKPVSAGELTQWDTSTITDGEYNLRLVVTLEDGSSLTAQNTNLRVRNYTPIETLTPEPTVTHAPGDTLVPTITPTSSITPLPPTATPLPPNPAQITPQDILMTIGKGILVAFGFFALMGIYQLIRSTTRR
jgi:hypothetical protein